jgi:hypothetical protein
VSDAAEYANYPLPDPAAYLLSGENVLTVVLLLGTLMPGVVAAQADTLVDNDSRTVLMTNMDVAVRFPNTPEAAAADFGGHGGRHPIGPVLEGVGGQRDGVVVDHRMLRPQGRWNERSQECPIGALSSATCRRIDWSVRIDRSRP